MKAVLLTLALASACAGTSSSMSSSPSGTVAANGQSCSSPLISAVAYRGTDVYAGPDSNLGPMIRLNTDTPVCASSTVAGYGFRRVTLADGRSGYVSDSNLSN
jgi:hypothetical protein